MGHYMGNTTVCSMQIYVHSQQKEGIGPDFQISVALYIMDNLQNCLIKFRHADKKFN